MVTSRDRLDGLVVRDGARRHAVAPLPRREARALLAGILGNRRLAAEPAAAAELARLCGYLPLALRVVATNLAARPGRGLAEHVAELATVDPLAGLAADGDDRTGVRAALDQSYGRLDPVDRRTFRLLGLLSGLVVGAAAVAALTAATVEQAGRTLRRLAAVHLVEEPPGSRYRLADLVSAYARQLCERQDSSWVRSAALRRLRSGPDPDGNPRLGPAGDPGRVSPPAARQAARLRRLTRAGRGRPPGPVRVASGTRRRSRPGPEPNPDWIGPALDQLAGAGCRAVEVAARRILADLARRDSHWPGRYDSSDRWIGAALSVRRPATHPATDPAVFAAGCAGRPHGP